MFVISPRVNRCMVSKINQSIHIQTKQNLHVTFFISLHSCDSHISFAHNIHKFILWYIFVHGTSYPSQDTWYRRPFVLSLFYNYWAIFLFWLRFPLFHMILSQQAIWASHQMHLQRKPLVSDPGMHHCTCVTHVPWCMSGSLTRGGGENVPDPPGACTTRNFAYLARGQLMNMVAIDNIVSLSKVSSWCFLIDTDIPIVWEAMQYDGYFHQLTHISLKVLQLFKISSIQTHLFYIWFTSWLVVRRQWIWTSCFLQASVGSPIFHTSYTLRKLSMI